MEKRKTKPVIVIPTNRPERLEKFFDDWKEQFKGVKVMLIFDGTTKEWNKHEIYIPKELDVEYATWDDIDKDLKDKAWIIPRKTDCVRSYGFYKAWQLNPEFILTLDDDTKPYGDTIGDHYNALQYKEHDNNYYNTIKFGKLLPRGYMKWFDNVFFDTVLSHGGWVGVPDFDAKTQLKAPELMMIEEQDFNRGIIPIGSYFSMCGMNLAFKPEIIPLMYFGLQGHIKKGKELEKLPIDRCGDIWCGYYVSQKLKPPLHGVVTGFSFVKHDRASNVWSNLEKEQEAPDMSAQFVEFIIKEEDIDYGYVEYWKKLREAYKVWASLFEKND